MSLIKRTNRFLKMNDWVWSVPIAFFAYQVINFLPAVILGAPIAYYTINWVQPLLATGGVMAGLMTISRLGMYFFFKRLHDYVWGYRDDQGKFVVKSYEDFENLPKWLKISLVLLLLFVFFFAAKAVYLRFIPLAGPQ